MFAIMETDSEILETNAAVDSIRTLETVGVAVRGNLRERPDPAWVRGECPSCGEPLVSGCYYVGGKGYLITHECWASLGTEPTCSYRKVL